eukprot:GHVT01039746.1.p2 GENE.GHVT01039746.1~~GHVT01039746.1.p2  ORF type:complete len:117 (-),score=6.38 GHVT01039746.1:135-485(-)
MVNVMKSVPKCALGCRARLRLVRARVWAHSCRRSSASLASCWWAQRNSPWMARDIRPVLAMLSSPSILGSGSIRTGASRSQVFGVVMVSIGPPSSSTVCGIRSRSDISSSVVVSPP